MSTECDVNGATARATLGVKWPTAPRWPCDLRLAWTGDNGTVALSQRKALYEVMQTLDLHPPSAAKLSLDRYLRSDDPNAPISIHHKIGRGVLNLTCIPITPAESPEPVPPPPPVHPRHSCSHPEDKDDDDDDKKAEDEAGASISGGMLAYLFMNDHSLGMAHKVGGAGLVLLYVVQFAIGSWVHRIPAESHISAHDVAWPRRGWPRHARVVLISIFSLYVFGVVMVKWRFGSVQVAEKGEGSALDMRAPNDELADGGKKL
ncbi:hypothetical protein H4582DRAFT_2077124 [Lactarius indigo]|nr:hypothetical protein H4582DRAFT_2077124 [Lactarius indigo]